MPNLGHKHKCQKCSTKFYDMGATVAVCPACSQEVKQNLPLFSYLEFPIPSDEPNAVLSSNDNYTVEDLPQEESFET